MTEQALPADAAGVPPVPLSAAEHARRTAELLRLRDRREQEIARRRLRARTDGDPSVAEDLDAITADAEALDLRIARVEDLLAGARIAAADEPRVGATLVVDDLDRGRRLRHRLAAPFEAGTAGAVSLASPVGRALAAARPGEIVEIALDGGRTRRLALVAIEEDGDGHNGS